MFSKGKNIAESSFADPKDLYVRIFTLLGEDEKRSYCWYKLPNWDDDESRTTTSVDVLSPSFKQEEPDFYYNSAQVAVGPFIVVLGGQDFQISDPRNYGNTYPDVFVIDTRNPDAGWKKGPDLCLPRTRGYAFVLGNTICIFGGTHFYPFGEVLDLETGIWKFLKMAAVANNPPPTDTIAHGILFGNSKDYYATTSSHSMFYEYTPDNCNPYPKVVYLHGKLSGLSSYDFRTAQFGLIKKPFNSSGYPTVSVGDILYIFDPKLKGYSMTKKKWFHVSGFDQHPNALPPSISDDPLVTPPYSLLHMGNGVLCLLWASSSLPPKNVLLHCTNFTVQIDYIYGRFSAKAVVHKYKTYRLPQGTLQDCVAVSTSSTITFPFVRKSPV